MYVLKSSMSQSISSFNLFCLIITPIKLLVNSCTMLVSILDKLVLISIAGLLVGLITIYMCSNLDPTRKLPPIRVPNPNYVRPSGDASRPSEPTRYLPEQGMPDLPPVRVPNPTYVPPAPVEIPGYIPPTKTPGKPVLPLTGATGPSDYLKPKF
jgi:hypothetical protein